MLRPVIRSTKGGTSPHTYRLAVGLTGLGLVTITCMVVGGAGPLLLLLLV
jgi:hypothetical protein